ncbi:MAG TPA: hypothetical protein VGE26_10400 [Sphingobacteriaceae bacterium]
MKIQYLAISISTVSIGLIMTFLYRPYIYENRIFDFWIADSIGSLVCVVADVSAGFRDGYNSVPK